MKDYNLNMGKPHFDLADKTFMMGVCMENGIAIQHAGCELKQDTDIALVACHQNAHALKHFSAELQANKEIVSIACSKDGKAVAVICKCK